MYYFPEIINKGCHSVQMVVYKFVSGKTERKFEDKTMV